MAGILRSHGSRFASFGISFLVGIKWCFDHPYTAFCGEQDVDLLLAGEERREGGGGEEGAIWKNHLMAVRPYRLVEHSGIFYTFLICAVEPKLKVYIPLSCKQRAPFGLSTPFIKHWNSPLDVYSTHAFCHSDSSSFSLPTQFWIYNSRCVLSKIVTCCLQWKKIERKRNRKLFLAKLPVVAVEPEAAQAWWGARCRVCF